MLGALGAAACLFLGAGNLQAQEPSPGNFDPAQMRQRMLERLREQFDVKEDSEWKIISERINKVFELRRGLGGPGGPGGFGFPGGFRGGPPPQMGGQRPDDGQGGPGGFGPPGGFPGGPGGPMGFVREPNPELDALRTAIEAKATTAELKARMAQLREARKKKEAGLEKAQEDLRQILSVRQEAVAMLTRSSEGWASRSRLVQPPRRRRWMPATPAWRIRRSTRLREQWTPWPSLSSGTRGDR